MDNIYVRPATEHNRLKVATREVGEAGDTTHYPLYILCDANGNEAYVDQYSGAVGVIEQEHLKIHSGKLFTISARFSLTAGATKEFLAEVPSFVFPHFRSFVVVGGGTPFDVDFYEDRTYSTKGTPITPYNNNRNSSTQPNLLLYDSPTGAANGTLLETVLVPVSAKDSGGLGSDSSNEWILKQGSFYSMVITNNSGGTETFTANMFWYE